ncbi:MAG: NADH-quinone oxidoreductase subunit C [Acidimicrobiia bacterium]|nr:NADH-quinone oxidoreductase subunit C [Acidimicrobiia bacterium]
MIDATAIIDALTPLVPGAEFDRSPSTDQPTVYVDAAHLVETCAALRDQLRFDLLADVTAVDLLPREPRFEIVYHLVSTRGHDRLRLKVRVGADGSVPTVAGIWRGAGWPEREVWDLFGVGFDGHPDLRRILMPDNWDGHPLRKDFPVQVQKTPQTYEPLSVSEQEFRANIARDRRARQGGEGG